MNIMSMLRDRFGKSSDKTAIQGLRPGSAADQMIAKGRFAQILRRDFQGERDSHSHALAWLTLEKTMGLVPGFESSTDTDETKSTLIRRPPFYLDRHAVTNAEFAEFVAAGAYGQTDLWPESLWSQVLQFVDRTGIPAPRYWSNGQFPRGREQHPVVGICWYEAQAYAIWIGKRLPEPDEWQHSASWCSTPDGHGVQSRYPWGNTFDPARANTWHGGLGDTVPVEDFHAGATRNGLYQLVGNTWEWTAAPYRCQSSQPDVQILFSQPMAELRGGAFDTFFESQANSFFRTGQPMTYRGRNVGFRCALSARQVVEPSDPTAYLQT